MTILKGGSDRCDLTGKQRPGAYIRLGTGAAVFLSWKALQQQVALATKAGADAAAKPSFVGEERAA